MKIKFGSLSKFAVIALGIAGIFTACGVNDVVDSDINRDISSNATTTAAMTAADTTTNDSFGTPAGSQTDETDTPMKPDGTQPMVTEAGKAVTSLAKAEDVQPLDSVSNKESGFGQGVQFNDKDVPAGAVDFNEKYRQYEAYAYIEDENKQNNIYLTFDQGYENGYTTPILDVLKEKGAKATFFITGDYMRHTDKALIQRMVDEGHTLGVHGDRHKSIAKLLETSVEDAAKEINNVRDALEEQYGYRAVYCRPPEGVFSERSLAFTQQQGYKSFLWSFAYKDWLTEDQPDTAEALEKITAHPHGGGIFLLHSVSSTNAAVLGDVIDRLTAKGYNLVGLDI